jgi:hypothetical protein
MEKMENGCFFTMGFALLKRIFRNISMFYEQLSVQFVKLADQTKMLTRYLAYCLSKFLNYVLGTRNRIRTFYGMHSVINSHAIFTHLIVIHTVTINY